MSTESSARGRRKEPQQSRSKQLVSCIVEAGLRLLEEEGPDALSTTRVADVAGVSVGSVYQYFSNREGIVDAVYRHKLELEWNQAQSWDGYPNLPASQMIELFIDKSVERHRRFLKLHTEFYRERVDDFSLGTFSMNPSLRSIAWFRDVFETHRDELQLDNPEQIAYLVARGIAAILHTTIQERPEYLFEDAFIQELKEFVACYLRSKERRAPDNPSQTDGFHGTKD